MSHYKSLFTTLLKYDLRDWMTWVFTFLVPTVLLVVLVSMVRSGVPEAEQPEVINAVSAGIVAFSVAFTGFFSGATHIALWRENGLLSVLRTFPISAAKLLVIQVVVGLLVLAAQMAVVVGVAVAVGADLSATAPIAIVPVLLGYLLFFALGVLLALAVPTIAAVSIGANFVIMTLGVIGGAMMPLENMAGWVQDIAPYTPIYHIREATAMPLASVGNWTDFGIGIAYLTVFTVVFGALAQRLMSFDK